MGHGASAEGSERFGYGMNGDVIDIGLVTGLDYADPTTDPHNLFQQMKLLPAIRPLLEGGTMIKYGAKAIPEGGLHAMPRFYADGLCLIGDGAGFLNGLRLKGIHLASTSTGPWRRCNGLIRVST